MNFTFNSKETYLQFRAEWKEQHYALIKAVRQAKVNIKNAMRAYAKSEGSIGDIWSAQSAKWKAVEAVNDHVHDLARARVLAGQQMMAARSK